MAPAGEGGWGWGIVSLSPDRAGQAFASWRSLLTGSLNSSSCSCSFHVPKSLAAFHLGGREWMLRAGQSELRAAGIRRARSRKPAQSLPGRLQGLPASLVSGATASQMGVPRSVWALAEAGGQRWWQGPASICGLPAWLVGGAEGSESAGRVGSVPGATQGW